MVYVPDDRTSGACQALTTLIGGTPVCLGTRDLRAVRTHPCAGQGDAAFVCPTGRVGFLAGRTAPWASCSEAMGTTRQ